MNDRFPANAQTSKGAFPKLLDSITTVGPTFGKPYLNLEIDAAKLANIEEGLKENKIGFPPLKQRRDRPIRFCFTLVYWNAKKTAQDPRAKFKGKICGLLRQRHKSGDF